MSTALSWLWTKAELLPFWRKITLRRHRSELRALRTARTMAATAIFPILLVVGTWLFLLVVLPSFLLLLLAQTLQTADGTVGEVLYAAMSLIYLMFLFLSNCLVIPWGFRWYRIAAGLTRGSNALADRKEAELVAAITFADPPG